MKRYESKWKEKNRNNHILLNFDIKINAEDGKDGTSVDKAYVLEWYDAMLIKK